jgi:Ca2+-binding EF-hand superfamily protein
MDSFSPQFEQQLKREILDVFIMVDSDNDGFLTAHEIAKLLQPNPVDSNFNMRKAHEVLSQIDSNQDGRVSKEEFVAFMLDI